MLSQPAPHSHLSDAVHELVEWEIQVAYHQGYQAALTDIAGRHAELDVTWRPIGRRTREQRVAERIADMERHAARVADQMGRPGYEYHGGPVDWHTGRPTRHLQAVS